MPVMLMNERNRSSSSPLRSLDENNTVGAYKLYIYLRYVYSTVLVAQRSKVMAWRGVAASLQPVLQTPIEDRMASIEEGLYALYAVQAIGTGLVRLGYVRGSGPPYHLCTQL